VVVVTLHINWVLIAGVVFSIACWAIVVKALL